MTEAAEAKKRDFGDGFFVGDLADGAMALGQVTGEDVIPVSYTHLDVYKRQSQPSLTG